MWLFMLLFGPASWASLLAPSVDAAERGDRRFND